MSEVTVAGSQEQGDYRVAASLCEAVAARHGLVRTPVDGLPATILAYERPHDGTGPSLMVHREPGVAARVSVTGSEFTDGGRREIAGDVVARFRQRFGEQRVHYSEETWIEW